jgi:uncharacterized protein YdeI (YjbR/CyaY-like superfamily)
VEKHALRFGGRAAWRAWLEANHAAARSVIVAHLKRGAPGPGISYDDAVEEALCFGWIDSRGGGLDQHHSWLTFTPRRKGGNWARSNRERVGRLAAAGLMTPAGQAVIDQARTDGSWDRSIERERRRAAAD